MPSNDNRCRNDLHEWVEENIFYASDGKARCRECARERGRKFEAKKTRIPSKQAAYVRANRARKVEVINRYKAERGCLVCGEQDPVVLDLDHRDPSTKAPALRRSHGGIREFAAMSWARLAEELEKCDVLCANCHRRKTAQNRDRQWNAVLASTTE